MRPSLYAPVKVALAGVDARANKASAEVLWQSIRKDA